MNTIKNLPILDLNRENIETEWPKLIDSIKNSSFISIDIVIVTSKFFNIVYNSN